ncbi:NAD/NADP transhydrogenase [Paenibacillus popilliae ATCC 14706]|uniref:NAD/NADP transhydrogenase n=1 Tax=Paenibacillus popilliae ATCC 14706 TaxID=1212764 RepID=M9LIS2_PAEPP|nr:NAD/NADP transhydrogenase [Paenibacillus popilliae ATCC 14706]
MIRQQQTLVLSPYVALYDIVVPKDNMLRQINELVLLLRLKDMNLLDMLIGQTVALAIEQGILKSASIIVDATHTAAVITTGEKNDGKPLQTLIEKSQATGMQVKTVIGDMAYSEKDNLIYTKQNEIELVAKLSL